MNVLFSPSRFDVHSVTAFGRRMPLSGLRWVLLTVLLLPTALNGTATPARAATGDSSASRLLFQLAQERFGQLTQGDWELFVEVSTGTSPSVDHSDSERYLSSVRADIVVWLCTEPKVRPVLSHRGIVLERKHILGRIDLRYAQITFPLVFRECVIPDGIDLQDASVPELVLAGSVVSSIDASKLIVEHDLVINDGFQCTGQFNLYAAQIGGDLDADAAQLDHPGATCLNASEVNVRGDVLLRYGFHSVGEVTLEGARIGGDLQCDEARLESSGPDALFADGLKVEGHVFLRYDFHATGRVSLTGAKIDGDLDCEFGTFENADGAALAARRINVQGEIRFSDTRLKGTTDLSDARIEGNLTCLGSSVEGPFQMRGARIQGLFTWCRIAASDHLELDLRSASIGRLLDDRESWPRAGGLLLHGLTYETLDSAAPIAADERILWLRLQPDGVDHFRPQPYEHLAEVLRRSGHYAEAEEILIAKEQDSEVSLNWSERMLHRLLGVSIGYGYRPWRAFWIGIAMILIGAIVFWGGSRAGLIAATKEVEHVFEGDMEHRLSNDYPRFNPLVYSLDMFVPLLDLQQANYWLPSSARGQTLIDSKWYRLSVGGVLRFYLGLHIYLGWTLTTLLAVGLSGLVVQ